MSDVSGKPRVYAVPIEGGTAREISVGQGCVQAGGVPAEVDSVSVGGGEILVRTADRPSEDGRHCFVRVPRAGGTPRRVELDNVAVISPDGRFVAGGGASARETTVRSIEGGPVLATFPFAPLAGFDWAGDSAALLTIQRTERGAEVWRHPLSGEEKEILASIPPQDGTPLVVPIVSRDGRKVVVVVQTRVRDAVAFRLR